MNKTGIVELDIGVLRNAVIEEYNEVARSPEKGFHFHTGREHALRLGYRKEWLAAIPEGSVKSFAGTGNPFSLGELKPGESVVDIGCGAGIDSLIAATMVGPIGRVMAFDMTSSMLKKARASALEAGITNAVFREGFGENLPVPDGWADVVISNGVLNLMPDKKAAFAEMARVLKPRGRLQIADILVRKAVPDEAKQDINLWTG